MIKLNTLYVTRHVAALLCTMVFFDTNAQRVEMVDFGALSISLHQEFGDDFDFSVLVARDTIVVYTGHFGFMDSNRTTPVNNQTLFNVASISKSITAVGIMKLVEANKIKLEEPLGNFFADVPHDKSTITIKMLLSHRSGLRQSYPLDGISDTDKALKTIWKEKLEFTPDNGFRYSNQNYQLLALIIEKVTQIPYEDYITEALLAPLGMNNTYFWNTVPVENLAPIEKRILNSLGKRNWAWIGGAGMFTATDDLYKFWNGIYRKGFLSQDSIDLLFGNYHKTQSGLEIGFGFYTSPDTKWNTPELWTRGTESWGHNGVIRYFPEKNVMIIVLTNSGEIGNDSNKTGNRLISDLIADYLFD